MDTVVEERNLVKRYGDLVAVNDVSFSVDKGEIFGFLRVKKGNILSTKY